MVTTQLARCFAGSRVQSVSGSNVVPAGAFTPMVTESASDGPLLVTTTRTVPTWLGCRVPGAGTVTVAPRSNSGVLVTASSSSVVIGAATPSETSMPAAVQERFAVLAAVAATVSATS